MAELQRLLQQNGTFKSELMEAFLSAAQVSFREHQRNNNTDNQKKSMGKEQKSSRSPSDQNQNSTSQQLVDSKAGIIEQNLDNYRIKQEIDNSPTDNERTVSTSDFGMTGDFNTITEIKPEPGLDNNPFISSNSPPLPPMPDAASPFMMPQLSPETMMMMPDMMGMMDDNSMMANMMGGMNMNFELPDIEVNANEIDVERILEEVKQVPSELRVQLMQQVITTVGDAHMATVNPTYKSVAEANERLAQKLLDGEMPDMSKLNISPSMMWQKFMQEMVGEITNVVKFSKKLPGFGEIQQEDQITLIKKGSFEVLLMRMCLLVDHVKEEMFDPSMTMKSPRAKVRQMPMGAFIDEFFNVAAQLNPLKLTDEELGLFGAVLLMCPEREGLKSTLAVEKLNSLFLQSLYIFMRTNHNDAENKFATLLSVIPVFRLVNKKHWMALNTLKMKKAPVLEDFAELHKEIYDIKEDGTTE